MTDRHISLDAAIEVQSGKVRKNGLAVIVGPNGHCLALNTLAALSLQSTVMLCALPAPPEIE